MFIIFKSFLDRNGYVEDIQIMDLFAEQFKADSLSRFYNKQVPFDLVDRIKINQIFLTEIK